MKSKCYEKSLIALDEILLDNNQNWNEQVTKEHSLIDLLNLHVGDYNNLHQTKKVDDLMMKYGDVIIEAIEKDSTMKNPLKLIINNRTNSLLLVKIIEKLDLSEKNIQEKPGLSSIFNEMNVLENSAIRPSDFIVKLEELLKNKKHLEKFNKDLKLIYMLSNIFQDSYVNIDLNFTQHARKIIIDSFEYLETIDSDKLNFLKEKIKKDFKFENFKINLEYFNSANVIYKTSDSKSIHQKNEDNVTIKDYQNFLKLIDIPNNINIVKYNQEYCFEDLKIHINKNQLKKVYLDFTYDKIQYNNILIKENSKIIGNLRALIEKYDIKENLSLIPEKNRTEVLKEFEELFNFNNLKKNVQKENNNMEINKYLDNLYQNNKDMNVSSILNKIGKNGDIYNNLKLVKNISGLVDLKDIIPNYPEILKKIDDNFDELLKNNKIITKNFEISQNLIQENFNEKIDKKINDLLDLIKEEIKNLDHQPSIVMKMKMS